MMTASPFFKLRLACYAGLVATLSFGSSAVLSQESTPKIRILSSRNLTPSAAETDPARATQDSFPGSKKPQSLPLPPQVASNGKNLPRPNAVQNSKNGQLARPGVPDPSASRVADTKIGEAKTTAQENPNLTPAQLAQMKRTLALQRVSSMNQTASPRNVGVPQAKGPTIEQRQQAVAASASSAPSPSNQSVVADDGGPMNPVVGGIIKTSDPLASEISRENGSYYFVGAINGIPCRFRINSQVFGIKIPSGMANVTKILSPQIQQSLERSQEVILPIGSISFGSYRVKAVMAKIYIDKNENVIDIGTDALSDFKIKEVNGRNILVKA